MLIFNQGPLHNGSEAWMAPPGTTLNQCHVFSTIRFAVRVPDPHSLPYPFAQLNLIHSLSLSTAPSPTLWRASVPVF